MMRFGTLQHAFMILICTLFLTGCAGLQTYFEPPQVHVTSLSLLPSDGLAPRVRIDLHVVNPNLVPLALKGIAYKIRLEGHQILSGASSDLPVIEAYGEGTLSLEATADLVSGLQLVTDLLSRPREKFAYELEAKLDPGGIAPAIRIKDQGMINLQQGHY